MATKKRNPVAGKARNLISGIPPAAGTVDWSTEEIKAFRRKWPNSGFPANGILVAFDVFGDVVSSSPWDLLGPEVDAAAAAALVSDGRAFLVKGRYLKAEDVDFAVKGLKSSRRPNPRKRPKPGDEVILPGKGMGMVVEVLGRSTSAGMRRISGEWTIRVEGHKRLFYVDPAADGGWVAGGEDFQDDDPRYLRGKRRNPTADGLITEQEFETYDPYMKPDGNFFEFEDVKGKPTHKVWTVVDGDDGYLYASPGFHIVNKVGYLMTKKPWTDSTKDAVWFTGEDLRKFRWQPRGSNPSDPDTSSTAPPYYVRPSDQGGWMVKPIPGQVVKDFPAGNRGLQAAIRWAKVQNSGYGFSDVRVHPADTSGPRPGRRPNVDDEGPPEPDGVPGEVCPHGNSWSSGCSECETAERAKGGCEICMRDHPTEECDVGSEDGREPGHFDSSCSDDPYEHCTLCTTWKLCPRHRGMDALPRAGNPGNRSARETGDLSDDEFVSEAPSCPMCGGEGNFLGQLGHLEHFRCRQCGMDFNRKANPIEGEKVVWDSPLGRAEAPKAEIDHWLRRISKVLKANGHHLSVTTYTDFYKMATATLYATRPELPPLVRGGKDAGPNYRWDIGVAELENPLEVDYFLKHLHLAEDVLAQVLRIESPFYSDYIRPMRTAWGGKRGYEFALRFVHQQLLRAGKTIHSDG